MHLVYTAHVLVTSWKYIFLDKIMHATCHALVTFPHRWSIFPKKSGENGPLKILILIKKWYT